MKKYTIIFLLFSVCFIQAQTKQPKIGLVLSGGGAKGFAHVGVLKEIDKAGLQIDYIAGTSMGAIIGGLYAAGYSAIEIEDFVSKTNLLAVLQDELPRKAKPYFEKEFGENHFVTLPVSNRSIQLPKAISKGQNVLDLFTKYLSPVDHISDFSQLPIPFFCIGTDVETGKGIMLESGSLPLALRASGSFPTLLNPVEIDDKLLIDGGVANNFPADLMKEKGVDYIIGVDVQSNLIGREKLNSAVSILNQIVSYDIYDNSIKGKKYVDTYIKPDISNYTVVSFDKSNEIVGKGEEIAKKYRKVFDSLALLQTDKRLKKELKFSNQPFTIESIKVNGAKKFTAAFVRGRLNIQPGDVITKSEINDKIKFLSATDNYERIEYKVEDKKVTINLIEKKEQASVRIGAHFDQLYKSGVLTNYVNKSLLIKNDQLSVDLILGDKIRYNLNYFVDNGFHVSYGFKSRYNHFTSNSKFSSDINPDLNKIRVDYSDISNELFVQTTFGRKFAIGFGVEHKKLDVSTETLLTQSSDKLVFDDGHYFNAKAYLKIDTYNDVSFPTHGFYADVGGTYFLASNAGWFDPFPQIGGTIGFATTFGDRLTFQYTNNGGFTFSNPQSTIYDYYLGGYNKNFINNFVPMYGYDFAELSGRSFVRSEFLFRYKLSKNNYAVFIANYARLDDNVFSDGELFKDVLSGYALGYSLNTFIGPIELKYSWSPENRVSHWFFNLGFWF